jgi:TRAP-type C4-dicarboxylate transport system permease small subunit
MRFLNVLIWSILSIFFFVEPTFAAINNPEVTNFTKTTLNTIIALASLATTFFLVKGGYLYMTSSGKPDSLEEAKKIIKNAILGLALVLGAAVYSNLLNNAFTTPANTYTAQKED